MSFRLSTGVPTDPTTPDTEFSTDGGATFADCAEEITTGGSNGLGYLTLSGAETNNRVLLIAAKSANCVTTPVILHCRALASVGTGTLSAGSSGGGTLGTLLAYDVTGCFIMTTGGTGGGGTGGANNQARRILTYNTTTGAFTVSTWETTPDATTTYSVLLPEGVTLGMLRALNPATAGRTLVVDSAGLADANAVKLGPTGSGTAQTARDIGTSVAIDFTQVLPTAPVANTTGESLFITDNLVGRIGTAQAGGASTITLDSGASSTDGRYIGYGVFLYGGTGGGIRGVGQERTITAYNGTTKVATLAQAWGTNPDVTSKFMLFAHPFSNVGIWNGTVVATPATAGKPEVNVAAINNVSTSAVTTVKAVQGLAADGVVTTVTNQLTAAQVATGVWQDATSGDFTVSSSIGKSLYTSGVVPGGTNGLFIAGTNAATTITTSLTTHFVGTVDTVTTVTNQLTAAAIATGVWQDATAGDFTVSSSIGKSLYTSGVVPGGTNGLFIAGTNAATTITTSLTTHFIGTVDTVTTVTNQLTAAAIATGVWQDTTAGDFTTSSSIGKSLYTSGVVPGGTNGLFIAGTNAATTITTGLTTHFIGTVDTVTTYTGNTLQTGDSFARIGAAGVGLTAVSLSAAGIQAIWDAATTALTTAGSIGKRLVDFITTLVYSAPPTAAANATAVWQDTTAGDFTTASSIGKSLYNAFGANTSVFTVGALANAPTGGSAPTAAQIATAVWQDTTAGDFTTASSIGKSLYTAGVVPGGAAGLSIVGSAMTLDLTQAVPTSNTAQTTGDALNAARAQGFGKWTIVATTLTMYANDGTTAVKTFTLDSASAPTSRT